MVVTVSPASYCFQKPSHCSLKITCSGDSLSSRHIPNNSFEKLPSQAENTMAEGVTKGTHDRRDTQKESASSAQKTSPTPSRPKLGRGPTVTWFNQSFDQATLRSETKSSKYRQMRRQSSVSDFFHSMLSSSKSHIVGLLSSKKEKREKSVDSSKIIGQSTDSILVPKTSNVLNSIDKSKVNDNKEFQKDCCPANRADVFTVSQSNTGSEGGMISNSFKDSTKVFAKSTLDQKGNLKEVKRPSLYESLTGNTQSDLSNRHIKVHRTSSSSPISPNEKSFSFSSSISYAKLPSSNVRQASLQIQNVRERQTSSAPPGRSSNGASNNLMVIDPATFFKRTIVKSNSETFATESVDQMPLAKASSDGNCFRSGTHGTQSNVIARITNYLFLGSVEAAYSEPLLCKYNISSLIDMTNMPSTNVPLHKKTDCPCACVNKNHFRSKLNIGVDDIEWENLGQYYDEINAFINGSRKKGGRILIFSYMGQSRAAAATVQYLMCQYKMPFNEAYHIIKSKRPQTKINSGFVKTLRRLEQTLGLNTEDSAAVKQKRTLRRQRSDEVWAASKNVLLTPDENSALSFPYVVRGAWLEC